MGHTDDDSCKLPKPDRVAKQEAKICEDAIIRVLGWQAPNS
jgi:hypothetical protein